ncbi:hypothetical protein BD311DRAFT_467688 [Dichomitus squalens]|uniref:Uncharacterized protein n=1 Tax=Dichomitus squalens TaxID=114155 RepID=A0A4Q9MEY2_9APHY|nr:hypothetical protein BD311DRAFT_467688 [Dichomitus squalens]
MDGVAGDIKRTGVWAGISKGGRDGGSVDLSKSHTGDGVDCLPATCHQPTPANIRPRSHPLLPGACCASQIQLVTLRHIPKRRSPGPPRLAAPARSSCSFQIPPVQSPPRLPSHRPPSEGPELPSACPHLRPSNGIAIMPYSAVVRCASRSTWASEELKTCLSCRKQRISQPSPPPRRRTNHPQSTTPRCPCPNPAARFSPSSSATTSVGGVYVQVPRCTTGVLRGRPRRHPPL